MKELPLNWNQLYYSYLNNTNPINLYYSYTNQDSSICLKYYKKI